ncbi:MAG TPA: hypothetical protein VF832_09955, partial [Longimicrobiales bacterium]
MLRLPRALPVVALAAAIALAACSDAPTPLAPRTPAPSLDESGGDGGAITIGTPRIFETRDVAASHDLGPVQAATVNGINYHGGRVLTSFTNVAAVYWATSAVYSGGPAPGTHGAGSADGSLVGFFLRNLGGSPYFGINTTYYNAAGTHVANIVNYTQYWANNSYSVPSGTQSVSDAAMVGMLQYAFNHGLLTYDPNTLYAIFTPGKVNLGGGFGTQYCAYHNDATLTVNGVTRTVLYAAMPYDYAYPSACTNGTKSPNNDPGADAEVNTLAHETEETTTDPLGTAWWRTSNGYENADLCAWTWGPTFTTSNGGLANMTLGGKNFLV